MTTRSKILFAAVLFLAAANVAWRLWADWGLVTIDVAAAPVSTVIREIERQGGVKVASNVSGDTKVTMRVKRVTPAFALDVLGTNIEASASYVIVVAADKSKVAEAIGSVRAGKLADGWKRFVVPLGMFRGILDQGGGTPDPRKEQWTPKVAESKALHDYLLQGGMLTSAQFIAPESWNPTVSKLPAAGSVFSVAKKFATSVGGTAEEWFFMVVRPPRESEPDSGTGAVAEERAGRRGGGSFPGFLGGLGGPGGGGPVGRYALPQDDKARSELDTAVRTRIALLPPDRRATALAEYEERKKFFEEISQLPEAERRQKLEERMNQPATQARMENGMTRRGAMQTAEQRAERYRNYAERKSASQNQ